VIDLELARTNLRRWCRLGVAHGADHAYAYGHLCTDYGAALDEVERLRAQVRAWDAWATRRAA
jgi:hypothetical protein